MTQEKQRKLNSR